jgi:hypothetical protein
MQDTTTTAPSPITEDDIEAFIITLNESEDELHCEYDHCGVTVCGVAVTHKATDCTGSALICLQASKDIASRSIVQRCKYCSQPGYMCWHSYPI